MKNPIQNVWGQKERVKIYISRRDERERLSDKKMRKKPHLDAYFLLLFFFRLEVVHFLSLSDVDVRVFVRFFFFT